MATKYYPVMGACSRPPEPVDHLPFTLELECVDDLWDLLADVPHVERVVRAGGDQRALVHQERDLTGGGGGVTSDDTVLGSG